MARKAQAAFAEVEEDDTTPADVVEVEEQTVVDDLKTARIKGTFNFMWGQATYDFVDGKRYRIPADMYDYLRSYGNIYDTMA